MTGNRFVCRHSALNWAEFQTIQKWLHRTVEEQGFSDATIDLADLRQAYPNGAVPLIVLLDQYRQTQGVDFDIVPPSDPLCLRTMTEQNYLGYLAAGKSHAAVSGRPNALHQFTGDSQLNDLIDQQIHQVLERAVYAEGVLQSFEWALNEVAGNVLVHAGVDVGWLQVIVHPNSRHMAIAVADGGLGIPANIRSAYKEFSGKRDEDAIAFALQEGITSRPDFGQGKGLTGTLEIAKSNLGGRIAIHSQKGKVEWLDGRLRIAGDFPPFTGTFVDIQLDTSQPIAIEKALWGKGPAFPFNENFYGQDTRVGEMKFLLSEEASSFGNRPTAVKIRNKVENLLVSAPNDVLVIDFQNIDLIASSFADELFGKLVIALGFVGFLSRIRIVNINKFCRGIIDDVVQSRIVQSRSNQNE